MRLNERNFLLHVAFARKHAKAFYKGRDRQENLTKSKQYERMVDEFIQTHKADFLALLRDRHAKVSIFSAETEEVDADPEA